MMCGNQNTANQTNARVRSERNFVKRTRTRGVLVFVYVCGLRGSSSLKSSRVPSQRLPNSERDSFKSGNRMELQNHLWQGGLGAKQRILTLSRYSLPPIPNLVAEKTTEIYLFRFNLLK
jgi:hypothetical protein